MKTSRYTYDNVLDDGQEVLINKEHLITNDELNELEAIHTYRRLSELALMDKKTGDFNIKHLKDLHSYIFQDVYYNKEEMEEAGFINKSALRGELRLENISKGFQFANAMFIENTLNYLLNVELKNDNYLKGLPFDIFIKKLAYYFAELNVAHPFREGNGRSTREFIRQLSLEAGYEVNWSLLEDKDEDEEKKDNEKGKKDKFMEAMIASVNNTSKLEAILSEITQKIL